MEKLLYIMYIILSYAVGLSTVEVPTDILNHFWIQVAVLLLNPPHGARRVQKRNGRYVTVSVSEAKRLKTYNGYIYTVCNGRPQWTQVPVRV
jgi:hypothetical protein